MSPAVSNGLSILSKLYIHYTAESERGTDWPQDISVTQLGCPFWSDPPPPSYNACDDISGHPVIPTRVGRKIV